MVDFGLQGFPPTPDGMGRLEHIGAVLERVPPEFTTVWIDDHLQFGDRPRFEGWTLLTYLAARYPRFRYGHLVISQSFRNPALLAKMAATLQDLTDGRFILGIGAGWHEEEYRAYGYDYPSGGTRVDQLAEAIQVIRAMWTETPATFEGRFYRIDGAYCEPRPDPPIPIMVGTNGPKALGVVARHADWWNWDGPYDATFREPYEILKARCAEIGRPLEEIVLTAGAAVSMPDDPSTFEATYEHSFYPGKPFQVFGPAPTDVIRELDRLIDVGVRHFQVSFEDMVTFERFIDDVVPAMRPRLGPA
ncbi:MAG TPA: LLM class flavin-dependent oxidoreductase [Candidatus Limnocylindrales bacterium]|nr:LLM class flavin-dependent oxidoreductase [Candidatus Limnocylindrales bacterium]